MNAVLLQFSVEDVKVQSLNHKESLQDGVFVHAVTLSIDVKQLDVNILSPNIVHVKPRSKRSRADENFFDQPKRNAHADVA